MFLQGMSGGKDFGDIGLVHPAKKRIAGISGVHGAPFPLDMEKREDMPDLFPPSRRDDFPGDIIQFCVTGEDDTLVVAIEAGPKAEERRLGAADIFLIFRIRRIRHVFHRVIEFSEWHRGIERNVLGVFPDKPVHFASGLFHAPEPDRIFPHAVMILPRDEKAKAPDFSGAPPSAYVGTLNALEVVSIRTFQFVWAVNLQVISAQQALPTRAGSFLPARFPMGYFLHISGF